jgi:hypothetical protein
MNTIFIAIGAFAIAALGGLYLLSHVLRDKETPKLVTLLHGLFAVAGVVLLIMGVMKGHGPVVPLAIFVVAALGGLTVVYFDLTGKKIPKWLAMMHGVIAVIGFVALLLFAFGGNNAPM